MTFHRKMTDVIFKRIDCLATKHCRTLQRINNRQGTIAFFDNYINPNIDTILIGKPDKLWELSEKFDLCLRRNSDFRIAVEYVFNYDYFRQNSIYTATDLALSLNIKVCPYCNRNYTSCVRMNDGKKVVRHAFDHYFDRGTHPLLAVSFYNLIPSCTTCNSDIKHTASINLTNHLHPYVDNCTSDYKFSYKYSNALEAEYGLKVSVKTVDPRIKNTMDCFAIEPVYNAHTDILRDLIRTRNYFSDRYLDILSDNLLKGVIVSREEMYKIVFGAEYDTAKFLDKPFSKFKRDILEELGII